MIRYATDETFDAMIAEGPVVVDFYGTFCGPCKMVAAILEDLDDEFPFLNIVKVDTDECEQLTERFHIDGIPDLYFYKDGKLITRELGAIEESDFRRHLKHILYEL